MEHNIKILPEYFEQKLKGIKPWELRVNDRNYKDGDVLIEREWKKEGEYTGRVLIEQVLHVFHNLPYLPDDVVIMTTDSSIKKLAWADDVMRLLNDTSKREEHAGRRIAAFRQYTDLLKNRNVIERVLRKYEELDVMDEDAVIIHMRGLWNKGYRFVNGKRGMFKWK